MNDFDKDKNYNIIKKKIENKRNNYLKYLSFIFVVLFIIFVLYRNNTLDIKKDIKLVEDVKININEVSIIQENKDMDGVTVENAVNESNNYVCIPYYEILNGLDIPDDFDNKNYYKVRFKKLDPNSKDYGKINNYEYWYFNTRNNRRIIIALSDKNIPLGNTNINEENANYSIINGIKLQIYKYKNKYIAIFSYDGFNFNIESTDITQNEFINLLKSLIK